MMITYQDQLILGPANWKQNRENLILQQLHYNGRDVGELWTGQNPDQTQTEDLKQQLAACMQLMPTMGFASVSSMFTIRFWLLELMALYPQIINWAGVYFKQSYLYDDDGSDLILGPFIGERTDHWKIPLEKGLCGLALREERVINVADVNSDSRHIACSLKTKSELIIPIYTKNGKAVAELDLDSNTRSAFAQEIETNIRNLLATFPLPEKNHR